MDSELHGTWEENAKSVKMAKCRSCRHVNKRSAFRLVAKEERVRGDWSIEKVRHFDGVYRCPRCGTANPETYDEPIVEHELVQPDLFGGN